MNVPSSSRSRTKLSAIDLFCGCGGLTVGLQKAGFAVRAAVELDLKAQQTYKLNHPGVKLYGKDIRKLTPAAILNDLALQPGELDLLAGCPPCQGFSRLRTLNRQEAVSDPRNDLTKDFLRFVKKMRPKSVMFENVPALRQDVRFIQLQAELKRMGYWTAVEVLDAADYEVAQRRKRLILLASRVHTPVIGAKSAIRLTVRDMIFGMEEPADSDDQLHSFPENRSESVRALIRAVPHDGGSRSQLPVEHQLACHVRQKGFFDVYGRMAWDDVAPTITSGCINPSKGRFLHPTQDRAMTLREASILQGFPDDYKFDVLHGKEAIALMIGNALPPPFISAHARSLSKGIRAACVSC